MIYKRGCDKKGPNRTCSKCGERGACGVYWYKFMWQGKLVRESTKQGNDKEARNQESEHHTKLTQELREHKDAAKKFGCQVDDLLRCPCCSELFNGTLCVQTDSQKFCGSRCRDEWLERNRRVPTLAEFCSGRVEPWAKATFEKSCRKNWTWYRTGIRALTKYKPLAGTPLDKITGELASDFAAHRLREGMQIATANNSLRVLRRILNLAVEWGVRATAPKIKVLPRERRRERVITPEEEAQYLAASPDLLASIATVLADTGMRPEESFRLRWESVTWVNGRNGALLVNTAKRRRPGE